MGCFNWKIGVFHQTVVKGLLCPELFFESLKFFLIIMIGILMMSAKLAATGLLKIKAFWYKSYDVITSVNDATKRIYHVTQMIL